MSSVRVVAGAGVDPGAACCRCRAVGCHWDRLAGRAVCPDCQEGLVRGEGDPLIEKAEPRDCAVCGRRGTVRFLTFPLHEPEPVEIDLCPHHLRELLGRRLTARAFRRLRRRLNLAGFAVEQVFLLHEAFYSEAGEALRPVRDPN